MKVQRETMYVMAQMVEDSSNPAYRWMFDIILVMWFAGFRPCESQTDAKPRRTRRHQFVRQGLECEYATMTDPALLGNLHTNTLHYTEWILESIRL